MTIDPAQAAGQVQYESRTYYFCSAHCKSKFQAAPREYAVPSLQQKPGEGGR
jgi:Cu+-exporting ATPase